MKQKIFLISWCWMLLAACASDVVRDNNAKMDSLEYSYVAFSTTCQNTPKVFMFYDDKGVNFIRTLTQGGNTASIVMTCNTNAPQYFLLRLPTGRYTLRGFATKNLVNDDFGAMIFNVAPQQINYLGRFVVVANARHKEFFRDPNYGFLKTTIVDEYKTDVAWFAEHYRNIPASSYVMTFPTLDMKASQF